MNVQKNYEASTLTITCTVGECYLLQDGRAVYGTPTPDHAIIAQVYMDSQPHFMFDRAVATLEDFLDAEGWDMLEEFDPDDPTLADTITITVPMDRRCQVWPS